MPSVVSCKIMTESVSLKINKTYGRTYVVDYLIKTDDDDMMMGEVITQAALFAGANNDAFPSLWDAYNVRDETDTGAFLQDIDLKRWQGESQNKKWWVATCTWSPPDNGNNSVDFPNPNPLADTPKWHAEASTFRKKISRDVDDDRPIANTAGDFFENVETEDGRIMVVCTRNEGTFTTIVANMQIYRNSVNDDTFLGFGRATWRMAEIVMSTPMCREGVDYYQVTYKMELCTEEEENWHAYFENKGSMAYDKPKTDPTAIKSRVKVLSGDNKGQFKDFAYLAEDGTQLEDDADPIKVPTGTGEPFHLHPEKDWSLLGLTLPT